MASSEVEAGRYLTRIGACHDCHTPGFDEHGFNVPEEVYLTGTSVGWRGPWGTTYPSNLRIFASETPREVWLTVCRERMTRPPMPWTNLHAMSDADLLAIHSYLVHLGPTGSRAPEYVAPGEEPGTPCFLMDPGEVAAHPVYAACPPTGRVPAAELESFELAGAPVRLVVPSALTRDACSLIEQVVPAGAAAPTRRLERHDLVLQVLEGELVVRVGDAELRSLPGDRMVLPRGTPHALRNTGSRPAKLQVLASPGGYDDFLAELAELGTNPAADEVAELLAAYGVHEEPVRKGRP